MTKAIPKAGSRRNVRIGARKNARRIPKGVIHVQASFNNTIVTVTDIRGRVVSWSSAGTCGFKGTRRGTPFAAQMAAVNAIHTAVDQGMQRAEVMIKGPGLGRDAALRAIRRSGILLIFVRDVTPMPHNGCRPPKKRRKVTASTRTLQWKCVESRTDSKRLYYERFLLSPLLKGQANTIGIAMRRALLGEIEGTCITRVKYENAPHEYSTITDRINGACTVHKGYKFTLLNRLYRERLLFLGQEVDSEISNQLIGLMVYLSIEDDTKDLYLFINSPGGWVIPGVAIFDTMQFVRPEVHTICMGLAASMGSFILVGGEITKRLAFPHAWRQ
ncbi:hypothetical protein OROMI_034817 [Orobanche minor]